MTQAALDDLQLKLSTRARGLDGLQLLRVPLVPEVRLYLAEDSIVWWARMEAEAGTRMAPPFWASAWAGGQALARYILDNPVTVAGREVLDVAAGSGLVAIAAAKAGAANVVANDIDPYAIASMRLNAQVNGVRLRPWLGDLLEGSGGDAEVVLVGDVCYDLQLSGRVLGFIERAVARGADVLVGDPGRGHLPAEDMEVIASYRSPSDHAFIDAERDRTNVFRPVSSYRSVRRPADAAMPAS